MLEYKTNPNIRCARCDGRLVVQTDGTSTKVNLMQRNGVYFCKDSKECDQNIKAEETILDISLSNTSIKFKCNGHDIIEVTKK